MNSIDASKSGGQSPATSPLESSLRTTENFRDGIKRLNEEVRKFGLPDKDRAAQMLCRLAFSVCPDRLVSRRLVEENGWIKQVDETWVCRHQGLKQPSARGKVTMAIMRDLQVKINELHDAETAALFSVKKQSVTLKTVSPRPILIPE